MYFLLFKSIIKNSLTVFLSLYISLLLVEATLIYTDLDRKSLRSDIQKIIKNKKSRTNFDNRDLVELFKKDSDPLSILPFRTYGHFNENGNRLISDIIISKILNN